MRAKEISFLLCLLVFMASVFGYARHRVVQASPETTYRIEISAPVLPPTLLKALAGEFKGLVANFLLLEAASFIGGTDKIDEKQGAVIAQLLDLSSELDPYFKQTYIVAQGTLPWYTHQYEHTMMILKRSQTHRVWDWMPSFFIGFNHFYFFNDYSAASEALMDASKSLSAPPVLVTWAARLASKAGQFDAAIEFLADMIAITEDEATIELLAQRKATLEGALVIQKAVDAFNKVYGRMPHYLEELIENNILETIPSNPSNGTYLLKNGVVDY